VPESLSVLRRQRNRWQRGAFDSIFLHATMIGNPRFGMAGLVGMPYFMLFELFGPIIELTGYVLTVLGLALSLIPFQIALAFFVVSALFGTLLSASAVVLEHLTVGRYPAARDVLQLLAASIVENLGYRQLTAWWRLEGLVDAIRGKKGWGKMERKGFRKPS